MKAETDEEKTQQRKLTAILEAPEKMLPRSVRPQFQQMVESIMTEHKLRSVTERLQVQAYAALLLLERQELALLAVGKSSPKNQKDLTGARIQAEKALDATVQARRISGRSSEADERVEEAIRAGFDNVARGKVRRASDRVSAYLVLGEDLLQDYAGDVAFVCAKAFVQHLAEERGVSEAAIRGELVETFRAAGLKIPGPDAGVWNIYLRERRDMPTTAAGTVRAVLEVDEDPAPAPD